MNGVARPDPGGIDPWLAADTPVAKLLTLPKPAPDDLLDEVDLAPVINKVSNNGPDCLTPAA